METHVKKPINLVESALLKKKTSKFFKFLLSPQCENSPKKKTLA